MTTPTAQRVLPDQTHMGAPTFAVADLARSLDFYTRVLGMRRLDDGTAPRHATVGAGTTPLIHLREIDGARPFPDGATGLYHAAILMPSRPELGRVILNIAQHGYPLGGASDHLVSEAFYLDDPDGNGLEIYRDRPRDEWGWEGTQVKMANAPIDIDGIIGEAPNPNAPYAGMPDGTTIGHMHLRVGSIPLAEAFYVNTLGFDIVAKWSGALFVSAGGYHHHLGLNTWHSLGGTAAPDHSVGLRELVISLPAKGRSKLIERLTTANVAFSEDADGDLLFNDPWNLQIRVKS